MEFWGVEVKPGESLKVTPDSDKIFQISQVSLGEVKDSKGVDSVPIRVHINDQNLVIGILSAERMPQMQLDLVFEKEFELSHDWKNGSVYFFGYITDDQRIDDEDVCDSECSSHEEEDELDFVENGKLEIDVGGAKPAKSKPALGKPKSSTEPNLILVDPKKDDSSDEDSDSIDEEISLSDEDDSSSDEEDSLSDEDDKSSTKPKMILVEPKKDEDSVEEDGDEVATESSSSSDDEEVPHFGAGKNTKRPFEFASKIPVLAKKARSDSPQKTDGKKGTHAKQSPKTSVNINKSKEQNPKPTAQFSSKKRGSEKGFKSHKQAKRGGK